MDTLTCSVISIGSSVEVIGTDITARVNAIIMEESGIQYRISYWHENSRHTIWVDLNELKVIK